MEIIEKLAKKETLPQKNKDHNLSGNYTNFRECHIQPDWLLIYKYDDETLNLTRTGSHSDLFYVGILALTLNMVLFILVFNWRSL